MKPLPLIFMVLAVISVAVADVFFAYQAPFFTAVGALVQAVYFGFYQCVDDVGFAGRNGQTNAAKVTFRKAVFGSRAGRGSSFILKIRRFRF